MWGCGLNGLPGVDSLFSNTVTTHQSFLLIINKRKRGQQRKKYNHAQQYHNFNMFHLLSKFVRSLVAAVQDLFLTIVKRDHVFNLRAAEKDLFLLRWLQDLPAEACKSGQIHLSCSAEVISETSSCCLHAMSSS